MNATKIGIKKLWENLGGTHVTAVERLFFYLTGGNNHVVHALTREYHLGVSKIFDIQIYKQLSTVNRVYVTSS